MSKVSANINKLIFLVIRFNKFHLVNSVNYSASLAVIAMNLVNCRIPDCLGEVRNQAGEVKGIGY